MEEMEKKETRNPNNTPEIQRELTLPPRPKLDVFESVTERILDCLERGVVPWQSPSIARVGFPRNFLTGKQYSGINVFLLGVHEFQSPFFITFAQAHQLGGYVRCGEKGIPIVKYGTWQKDVTTQNAGGPGADGAQHPEPQRRFLKLYTVFNSCQIEGLVFPPPPNCATFTETAMAERARQVVGGMPNPPLILEGRKAIPHYVPVLDVVEIPERQTFRAEWRYYKTLFHELAHATGHEKRLNRKSLVETRGRIAAASGEKIYCQEELVAEMAAAFLGAHAGIIEDGFENSPAYVKGWLDALREGDHRRWLIRAASEAQRAAHYILGDPAERDTTVQ